MNYLSILKSIILLDLKVWLLIGQQHERDFLPLKIYIVAKVQHLTLLDIHVQVGDWVQNIFTNVIMLLGGFYFLASKDFS